MKKINLKRFSFTRIFIYILLAVFAVFALTNIKVIAAETTVELLVCNPGENSSTELNFNWHGTKGKSTFYITLSSDTNFSNATTVELDGIYDGATFFKEQIAYYRYTYNATDLSPNTTYIYKVACGNGKSAVNSATTAGTSGTFEFIYSSDNHAYKPGSSTERVTYLTKLFNQVEAEHDINLWVQGGDNVSYGGAYYCWREDYTSGVFNNHIWAPTCGNHDSYVYPEGSSVQAEDKTVYYRQVINIPDNGCGDTSYWYIYNSILFFSLDAMESHSSSEKLRAQKKWFGEVVEANEGKYQYIIAYQHYPWMNALTGANSGPYGTNRNVWKEVFDKYDVDLALAGDHHFAYRSKKLLGDEILSDDDLRGTVYIGSPQIGKRDRAMENNLDLEYYNWRSDDDADSSGTSGLYCFSVTPEGITGRLYDITKGVIDEFTLQAKRPVTWENNKDKINKSYVFTSDGTNSAVDMNTSYADCIKTVKVYNGDTLVGEADYTTGTYGSIAVTGLQNNKAYALKVVTDFIDNTSTTTTVYGSTYKHCGDLYGLNPTANGDKVTLSWNADLKNDVVASYKLFADGKEIATLKATDKSYDFKKADVTINTQYKLVAYSSTNEVIKELNAQYSVYGDANLDGQVNADDITYLLRLVREHYTFGENEIRILDQNLDGKVDVADATVIYNYNKRNISALHQETYQVIAIDNNGLVISIQEVKYGENAVAPKIKSASFDYWSDSFNFITHDIVIKSIYK